MCVLSTVLVLMLVSSCAWTSTDGAPHEDSNNQQWAIGNYITPIVSTQQSQEDYYVLSNHKANWYKAWEHCAYHGMGLASISSEEENKQLREMINSSDRSGDWFWTSGMDKGEEGKFVWMSSGRPITYSNWQPGEPNNDKNQDCLAVEISKGKLVWDDNNCNKSTYFVCDQYSAY